MKQASRPPSADSASGRAAEAQVGTIAVLLGGPSSEREVSLQSGRAVAEALTGLGFDVLRIDPDGNEPLEIPEEVDAVFLALHGTYGEDGEIQEIIDEHVESLDEAARQLVQTANDKGGKDNISVILARSLEPVSAKKSWYSRVFDWF